jgi:hypothetical protein
MHDMQHAFEHCFDAYKSCGVYRELLAERQARRGQAAGAHATTGGVRFLWATACASPAEAASDVSQKAADPSSAQSPTGHGGTVGGPRTQIVQLRVPGHLAAAAAVSAALALAAQ